MIEFKEGQLVKFTTHTGTQEISFIEKDKYGLHVSEGDNQYYYLSMIDVEPLSKPEILQHMEANGWGKEGDFMLKGSELQYVYINTNTIGIGIGVDGEERNLDTDEVELFKNNLTEASKFIKALNLA